MIATPKMSDAEILAQAFDAEFYRAAYPQIDSSVPALKHFLSQGWKQGLDANANFSVRWYLHAHPDVAAAGFHPLVHYVRHGRTEGRTFRASMSRVLLDRDRAIARPHFDSAFYLAQRGNNPVHADPLDDFLLRGCRLGLDPSAAFSCPEYFRSHPWLFATGINPLMHSLGLGEPCGSLARR